MRWDYFHKQHRQIVLCTGDRLLSVRYSLMFHTCEKKLSYKLPVVQIPLKNCVNIRSHLRPKMFCLWNTLHNQTAKVPSWSNQGRLLVTRRVAVRPIVWKQVCVAREVIWIKSIIRKSLENFRFGGSHFSCDITRDSPRPSWHSCNFGLFIGWWPYSPWATWSHKWHRCYASRYGDAAAIVETY